MDQYRSRLQAYLLQQSPPEESERLEAEIFQDDALFALLLQTEEELIEQFERGQLSQAEEQAFQAALAKSPRLGELLKANKALPARHDVPRARKVHFRLRCWPVAVAASILLALGLLAFWRMVRIKTSSLTGSPTARHEPSPASTLTAQLNIPGVRNDHSYTGTAIIVPPGTKELILQLPAGSVPSTPLTFSIRAADNPAPLLKGGVTSDVQKRPSLRIANSLPPNDYIVTIFSGTNSVADFYFRLNFSH